ncbi:L-aspartate oxidase [Streptoalloteichus tenebrarius]|uniref:L-aspartate oxidase n=1 Tax=Streptoalloteichus tenebrarius (strain ATCC 17920 / DSM 40477 / JCM 4838 / CBS 697.72 / NBRC 16177 / NCIMB 11028 / NRRL B-12390 / A12253. 1 / ISP 5477) TaxID=1933 RepID=A0ABT1HNA2_STRSD|nr:L-aspartate oxidase [Streptoalloteichus tenebrarius]MCP2256998.1 L-aspartate oxidase [Streptoalloteichus tenebrarius]BFF00091.1 L-aspartate oxidase [Streptoalloteichus tenebrarius]
MTPSWEAGADLVVVGTGVAGLTAAITARELGLRVLVVTKAGAGDGNTPWAQGGVAVVLPGQHEPGDSVRRHVADTLVAGAGLCEEAAVAAILADGPAAVQRLLRGGARFDTEEDGRLARGREGGHSTFRVVHAGGDATGAEVERALLATLRDGRIPVLEQHIAVEALRTPAGEVAGLLVLDAHGVPGAVRAPAVLLATGGVGQLYQATSNPEVATGDGLALAVRAGAALADVEFVQFHPTVLFTGAGAHGRRPLVTEAVRGEGAVLVDHTGARVMAGVHPLADLAPRDVVAAAITRRMVATGADHVLLDATRLGGEAFRRRFPTVHAACRAAGVDPAVDPIPVAPAAHFACGGVVTTVDGRASVTGLYAAGEVARTGLHGANRLASNSLLEGLVVGARAARAVAADLAAGRLADPRTAEPAELPAAPVVERAALQRAMSRYAAIGRDASGLVEAESVLDAHSVHRPLRTHQEVEDAALAMVARALVAAALERTETRGCHVRTDFPRTEEAWRRSLPIRLDAAGRLAFFETVALGGAA